MKELPPITDRRDSGLSQPAPQTPYVIAIMLMMILGVCATVLVVVLRPGNSENLTVIGLIFGFLAPTTLSLLSLMKSQETHLSVNSRLDGFMSNAKMASYARGMTEGRLEGRLSADERTDKLQQSHNDRTDSLSAKAAETVLTTVPSVANTLEHIDKNVERTADNTEIKKK